MRKMSSSIAANCSALSFLYIMIDTEYENLITVFLLKLRKNITNHVQVFRPITWHQFKILWPNILMIHLFDKDLFWSNSGKTYNLRIFHTTASKSQTVMTDISTYKFTMISNTVIYDQHYILSKHTFWKYLYIQYNLSIPNLVYSEICFNLNKCFGLNAIYYIFHMKLHCVFRILCISNSEHKIVNECLDY